MIDFSRGRAVAIGECMVELARGGDGRFGLAYGGDTFNTAAYLARAGVAVSYATALGDDPYSQAILDACETEGIATDLVAMLPGRMPGLYLIETNPAGERHFHYWRDRSPAREVLDGAAAAPILDAMTRASLVYLSGITLSLYSGAGLDCLARGLQAARNNGTIVVMDGNYRPRGWMGDAARARATMQRFWGLCDIALPTWDDEAALWGDKDAAATLARLRDLGLREIAIKLGAEGALIATPNGEARAVGVETRVTPIDTTAAGDSFNAAYLAARGLGRSADEAAAFGHRLAAAVIGHRGAIIPAAATATILRALNGR